MEETDFNGSLGKRRQLIERISAVKIHVSIIRRIVRRPGVVDKGAVAHQLDQIEEQVSEVVEVLQDESVTT